GRAPATSGPHDLAIGPMYFPAGLALATHTPAWWGYVPFGRHGRFYKLPLVVRPGATVTMTIGASARGHVLIGVGGALPGRGAPGPLTCPPAGRGGPTPGAPPSPARRSTAACRST